MDTVANCIVECFNQKDYTMYADYEQVLLKGNLGNLSYKFWPVCEFYTEFDSDSLRIQLSILAEFYHSFRQGGGRYTLHNAVDFLKKKRIKIWSPINLGLYPWSRLFWLCLQQMPALNKHSVHYEGWSLISVQPCQITASIVLCHTMFIRSWWNNNIKSPMTLWIE